MASDMVTREPNSRFESVPPEGSGAALAMLKKLLLPLASLKLTVTLFALSIFLIFAGTLAQDSKDMLEVMRLYFRTLFAWIDFQVFFPRAFFPNYFFEAQPQVSG